MDYGLYTRAQFSKHLMGRHDQDKHDPNKKGSQHSRDEHDIDDKVTPVTGGLGLAALLGLGDARSAVRSRGDFKQLSGLVDNLREQAGDSRAVRSSLMDDLKFWDDTAQGSIQHGRTNWRPPAERDIGMVNDLVDDLAGEQRRGRRIAGELAEAQSGSNAARVRARTQGRNAAAKGVAGAIAGAIIADYIQNKRREEEVAPAKELPMRIEVPTVYEPDARTMNWSDSDSDLDAVVGDDGMSEEAFLDFARDFYEERA